MKFYRPLKTNLMTQGFGLANTKPELILFYQSIGLKFGHNGIDWFAKDAEPIYWDYDGDGEVVAIHNDDPLNEGIGIIVYTNDENGLYQHRFWHLKSVACKLGKIEVGDLLGYADNTGHSTGTHLHRDLKPLTNKNGVFTNTLQTNGYDGCIDYSGWLDNRFVVDVVAPLKAQITLLKKMIEVYNKLIELLKIKGRN